MMERQRQRISLVSIAATVIITPSAGQAEPGAFIQDHRTIAVAHFKVQPTGTALACECDEVVHQSSVVARRPARCICLIAWRR